MSECVLLIEDDARIREIVERGLRTRGFAVLSAGDLTLDLTGHRVMLDGRAIALAAREVSLLATFLRHPGEVLSRERLLRLVWEIDFDPGSNVVDVYVSALRRKLGSRVIETVRHRGYRLGVVALAESATAG